MLDWQTNHHCHSETQANVILSLSTEWHLMFPTRRGKNYYIAVLVQRSEIFLKWERKRTFPFLTQRMWEGSASVKNKSVSHTRVFEICHQSGCQGSCRWSHLIVSRLPGGFTVTEQKKMASLPFLKANHFPIRLLGHSLMVHLWSCTVGYVVYIDRTTNISQRFPLV